MKDDLLTAISSLVQQMQSDRKEKRREFEWFRSHFELVTKQDLEQTEKRIMITQQELVDGLNKIKEQVGKVAKEQSDRFDTLTAKVAELTAIIAAGGTIGDEAVTALAGVQSALDELDNTIPDAPV